MVSTSGTGVVDTGQLMFSKGTAETATATATVASLGNGHFENWGESGMGDNSQQTDTSTDVDTDDKNQVFVFFTNALLYCTMESLGGSVWKTVTPFLNSYTLLITHKQSDYVCNALR